MAGDSISRGRGKQCQSGKVSCPRPGGASSGWFMVRFSDLDQPLTGVSWGLWLFVGEFKVGDGLGTKFLLLPQFNTQEIYTCISYLVLQFNRKNERPSLEGDSVGSSHPGAVSSPRVAMLVVKPPFRSPC